MAGGFACSRCACCRARVEVGRRGGGGGERRDGWASERRWGECVERWKQQEQRTPAAVDHGVWVEEEEAQALPSLASVPRGGARATTCSSFSFPSDSHSSQSRMRLTPIIAGAAALALTASPCASPRRPGHRPRPLAHAPLTPRPLAAHSRGPTRTSALLPPTLSPCRRVLNPSSLPRAARSSTSSRPSRAQRARAPPSVRTHFARRCPRYRRAN